MTKFGYKQTPEHIEKYRIKLLGQRRSDTTKQRLSNSKLFNKNPKWKGDSVGYRALHAWVRRNLPQSETCELCSTKPESGWMDLANVTGVYTREFSNWKYVCRMCHRKVDGPGHVVDYSGYRCSVCNSDRTEIRKNGKPRWSYVDGKPICRRCLERRNRRLKRESMQIL